MRTDEGAGVALDTLLRIPLWNIDGNSALFEGRGAGRHRSVGIFHECADRKRVAALGVDYIGHILHEARSQAVLARSLELSGDA